MINLDQTLRPDTFETFIGQEALKKEILVAVRAAKEQNRATRPILLCSGPGMGKTSLAHIIAHELGQDLRVVMCPFELPMITRAIRQPGVLFLDEIHRARRNEQESILGLVEDGVMMMGRIKFPANNVSIVGATTDPQKLVGPLMDRFQVRPTFDPYSNDEMTKIVLGMFAKTSLSFSEDDCEIFGKAAAGVPRLAKSFVTTAVDLQITTGEKPAVLDVLHLRRVREDGLSVEHTRYLGLLFQQEGKASLNLMASALNMPPAAIQQVEHLLILKGLLSITPRGRALTEVGWGWVQDNEPKEDAS